MSNKKGEDLLDAMARIQTEKKMAEVNDGIQTFLRLAYLKRKGIIKENIWSEELDTPTTIIDILSDWLVAYHFILKDIADRIPESETLNEVEASIKGIDPESNYFIQIADNWHVKYKEDKTILGNLKRLQYILYLLQDPETKIDSYEMVKRASGHIEGSDSL
jgi:hypothetical protein